MTTTDANRETLRQVRSDLQHTGRPRAIAEEQGAALERAGDLARAGLWVESRFVAEQARGATK